MPRFAQGANGIVSITNPGPVIDAFIEEPDPHRQHVVAKTHDSFYTGASLDSMGEDVFADIVRSPLALERPVDITVCPRCTGRMRVIEVAKGLAPDPRNRA